ncbi:MAG: ABC transporter ATP-binding protein [Candidatus Coproplasma sp.]
MEDNREVLLKVEHLCQYFKMAGGQELKAVDDVSFEIHRGEVFGLVGESGCGKTTTGRAIIKLYDITSGDVFFKGRRISTGTRGNTDAVRRARAEYRAEVAEVKKLIKAAAAAGATEVNPEYTQRLAAAEEKLCKTVEEQKEKIKTAKREVKTGQDDFVAAEVKKVEEKYAEKFAQTMSEEERAKLQKEYKTQLKLAKNARIMNAMQMIFQDPIASLDPRMTVRDIIAEGLIIRGVRDKQYIDEQVYKMLDLVGLVPEHAGRYPHEFSGGQRQRIGIARAIILNPELIIADEPISALDVSIQAQVINLLNDLRDKLGLTILFIAHDLSVVKYFSDRIGVMYFGKMVELASADELFAHPLHPYTRSLLSAIPLPDPEYEKGRKRITYNPIAEHDYSVDKPSFREVSAGHFVMCNDAEYEKYKAEVAK